RLPLRSSPFPPDRPPFAPRANALRRAAFVRARSPAASGASAGWPLTTSCARTDKSAERRAALLKGNGHIHVLLEQILNRSTAGDRPVERRIRAGAVGTRLDHHAGFLISAKHRDNLLLGAAVVRIDPLLDPAAYAPHNIDRG